MKKYRLIGEVGVRKDFGGEDIIRHTEVVEDIDDASREDLIDLSLSGFTDEQQPSWCRGYPLILPEPDEPGAAIAGEAELRSQVLLEALPYIEVVQASRFGCESIQYVAGVTTTALNERGVRATVGEVRQFLAEAGYPTHRP